MANSTELSSVLLRANRSTVSPSTTPKTRIEGIAKICYTHIDTF